eukprot:10172454-Ditylum_brightwellii.AAC.1
MGWCKKGASFLIKVQVFLLVWDGDLKCNFIVDICYEGECWKCQDIVLICMLGASLDTYMAFDAEEGQLQSRYIKDVDELDSILIDVDVDCA